MNENIVKGKWREIKGEIQKVWADLSGDDLDRTEGNMNSVAGVIQKKYGTGQDEVSRKLSDIYRRFDQSSTDSVDANSAKINNTDVKNHH